MKHPNKVTMYWHQKLGFILEKNYLKYTSHTTEIDTYIKKTDVNMQINVYIIDGSIFPESRDSHYFFHSPLKIQYVLGYYN
jgi:hypothetical protein